MYRAGADEYSYQSHTGTGTGRVAPVDADAISPRAVFGRHAVKPQRRLLTKKEVRKLKQIRDLIDDS